MTNSAVSYGPPIDILHPEPTVDSILEAALHFMKRFGWIKGKLGGNAKHVSDTDYDFFPACSVGAINAVTDALPIRNRGRLREEARAALMRDGIKGAGISIEGWNDRSRTTQEHVFQAFRDAVQANRA